MGRTNQDNSLRAGRSDFKSQLLTLRDILKSSSNPFTNEESATAPPINPYKTFKERANRYSGQKGIDPHKMQFKFDNDILFQDPAVQTYAAHLRNHKNRRQLNKQQIEYLRGLTGNFAYFANLEITNHAFSDLVTWKKMHPLDTKIEQTLQAFSEIPSVKSGLTISSHRKASMLLGLFKANFAPLQLRINTHYPPVEENCLEETFLQIYSEISSEQKDMIQWGQYVVERANAAYRVLLKDIDLSGNDYAVVWIREENSKVSVKHPCFVPIQLAKRIIASAKATGRTCPFPNHQSQWKCISKIAKEKYNVRLVSNYLRKRFCEIADDTNIKKSTAAFILGDDTKLRYETIHLARSYQIGLRPKWINKLIAEFHNSGLAYALCLDNQLLNQMRNSSISNYKNPLNQFSKLQDLENFHETVSLFYEQTHSL